MTPRAPAVTTTPAHTPGPWLIHGWDIVAGPERVRIARIIAPVLFGSTKAAANAELIASAPTLRANHDALVAALRDCDGEAYNGQLDGHDPLASLAEIQRLARAVLAAVEGK